MPAHQNNAVLEDAYFSNPRFILTSKSKKERNRELASICGTDAPISAHDYFRAVKTVNKDSALGMNADEEYLFGRAYTALGAHAKRFRNEPHIHIDNGSNSATHSLFGVILLDDVVNDAIKTYGAADGRELTALRVAAGRSILMHDMGEAFGEFSSLAQTIDNKDRKKDIPEIERMAADYTLRRAAYAMQTGNHDFFMNGMRPLREAFKKNIVSGVVPTVKEFDAMLDTYYIPPLNPHHQQLVDKWMGYYDLAESAANKDNFLTHLVKNAEHAQGNRHFNKFQGITPEGAVEKALPSPFSSSKKVLGNGRYTEANIGDMFAAMKTPTQVAVAKAMRDNLYRTAGEFHTLTMKTLDRNPHDNEPEPLAPNRLEHTQTFVDQHRSERKGMGRAEDILLRYETSRRLAALYAHAIEKDYIAKPGEVLSNLAALPTELKGFARYREPAAARQ